MTSLTPSTRMPNSRRGVRRAAPRAAGERDRRRCRLRLRRLALLEPLHDLVTTGFGVIFAAAERDIEVLRLAEAHLADHVGEQRRAVDASAPAAPACAAAPAAPRGRLCSVSWRDSALNHALILLRARVVLTSASQSRDGPALALGGQHLDDVAGAQLIGERHDLAVDLCADAAVTDIRVNLVGEVQRRRAGGQRLDLALRGEHEHLVLEQVDLAASP